MFCPECGKENKDTAKFCTGCGIGLETDIETQPIPKDTKKIVMACVIGLGVVVAIVGLLVWPKMMHLSDVAREGATKGSLVGAALRSALSTFLRAAKPPEIQFQGSKKLHPKHSPRG